VSESDQLTAMCRNEGCGKRFTLARYGNRTSTSERARKGRHRFCSSACRVAHHRRIRGAVTPPKGMGPVTLHPPKTSVPLQPKSMTYRAQKHPKKHLRVFSSPANGCASILRMRPGNRFRTSSNHCRQDHAQVDSHSRPRRPRCKA